MITTIMGREFKEIVRTKSLLVSFIMAPLLLLIFSVFTTLATRRGNILHGLLKVIQLANPLLAHSEGQLITARFYFSLFVILAAVLPLTFATTSIITEKMSGSLESILATPISTNKLLLGKILSFTIPSTCITWVIQLIFIAFVQLAFNAISVFFTPVLIISTLLVTLLISMISASLGLIVSTKVNNIPSAQQFGGILALPVLGLAGGQVFFTSFMSSRVFFLVILIILLSVALALFQLNRLLFKRESIITSWK